MDSLNIYEHIDHVDIESLPPRERILEAARILFYEEGLHAVGVDAVAAKAKTNKMTLYRHFKSKDDLIAAYLQYIANIGFAVWDAIAQKYPNDPLGQLEEWLRQTCPGGDSCIGNRGCAFVNAAAELPDKSHPGRIVIEEVKTRFHKMILDLCEKANLSEPERLTDELHLLFEGASACFQSLGPTGPSARFTSAALALIEAHKR